MNEADKEYDWKQERADWELLKKQITREEWVKSLSYKQIWQIKAKVLKDYRIKKCQSIKRAINLKEKKTIL